MHKLNSSENHLLSVAKMQKPVDVVGLIKKLGIIYKECLMNAGQSGYIQRDTSGDYTIAINKSESLQRKRFTAAHELGHYYLHRDKLHKGGRHLDRLFDGNKNVQGSRNSIASYDEFQANRFAAELLMPESVLRREYTIGADYRDIAGEFGVSHKAMAWRLVNLRLASKMQVGLG